MFRVDVDYGVITVTIIFFEQFFGVIMRYGEDMRKRKCNTSINYEFL